MGERSAAGETRPVDNPMAVAERLLAVPTVSLGEPERRALLRALHSPDLIRELESLLGNRLHASAVPVVVEALLRGRFLINQLLDWPGGSIESFMAQLATEAVRGSVAVERLGHQIEGIYASRESFIGFVMNRGCPRTEAEDCLSEAVIRLYENRLRYPAQMMTDSELVHYLYRTLMNGLNNRHRAEQRRPLEISLDAVEGAEHDGIPGQVPTWDDTTPLSQLLAAESMRRVQDALRTLTAKERAVMTLLFFEEYTPEEVARLTELSVDNIYSTKYQAVKKMRRYLREHPERDRVL